MSHFTVLVVGENPEEQLKPFQENNMGDCPEKYTEFYDQEDEFKDEYENKSIDQYRFKDQDKWYYSWDKELTDSLIKMLPVNFLPAKKHPFHGQLKDQSEELKKDLLEKEELIKEERPFKVIYGSFDEFCKDWHGLSGRDKQTGKYGYWENPNRKWDWYELGGRWTGSFKLKVSNKVVAIVDNGFGMSEGEFGALVKLNEENHGKFDKLVQERKWGDLTPQIAKAIKSGQRYEEIINESLPKHKVGKPGLMTEPAKNGYADSAYKRDIDFEGMYREAEEGAHEEYDKFEKATRGVEPVLPWEEFIKSFDNIDDARKAYHNHPWNKGLWDAGFQFFGEDSVDYFCINNGGKESFVSKKKKEAITTFAVLMSGQWYEKGKMGWWGSISDKKDDWDDQFYKLFESISYDTLLSVVDCHI